MSNEHRTPEGTPAGGQFATIARTEPAVILLDPMGEAERDADTTLSRSLMEAARLSGRLRDAVQVRDAAIHRANWYDDVRWGSAVALESAEEAARATEDVNDIQSLRDATALGLALLQSRVDLFQRKLEVAAVSRSSAVQQSAQYSRSSGAEARARLGAADTDPDLVPVPGALDMAADLYDQWADVAMVAAPVRDVDQEHPVAYRVSFISVDAGAEVARITMPAASCTAVGTHRLDASTVAHGLAVLSRNPVGVDGAAARELVEHLAGRAERSAA